MSKRKTGMILNCEYGHLWPLGNHSKGYVKVICQDSNLYIWAESKASFNN